MKIISTKIHGVLDYVMGAVLIIAPWILGFAAGGAETWIMVILGASTIAYSLFTDYELGVSPALSMKTHLGLDTAAAIVLIASPWIFGFSELVYLPHVVLGALELGAVLLTQTEPVHGAAEERTVKEPAKPVGTQEHTRQKVEVETPGRNTVTENSPQTQAKTNMHHRVKEEVHKAGIHNKEKRAAEPSDAKKEDASSNEGQELRANVNFPTPGKGGQSSSRNFEKRKAEYKSNRNPSTENTQRTDEAFSGTKSKEKPSNTSKGSERNSPLETPDSDQNISAKSQDVREVNKNIDPKIRNNENKKGGV